MEVVMLRLIINNFKVFGVGMIKSVKFIQKFTSTIIITGITKLLTVHNTFFEKRFRINSIT